VLLLLVLVTPHHGWYFLWLLPILCLVPYWPVLLLTALSFILYATLGLPTPSRDLVINSLLLRALPACGAESSMRSSPGTRHGPFGSELR
jgi:hypothetical protein